MELTDEGRVALILEQGPLTREEFEELHPDAADTYLEAQLDNLEFWGVEEYLKHKEQFRKNFLAALEAGHV